MSKKYLFILGRNYELSKAELLNFCDEIFTNPEKSLFIGENLRFKNPRNLPKSSEQLFLDRLGGVIRFGEILGEVNHEKDILILMQEVIKKEKPEGKLHLGISVFGCGKQFLKPFLNQTKKFMSQQDRSVRIENRPFKNFTSGQIFDCKLLKKGFEFLIWKNKNSFLVAKTVANQNIRNYILRDRIKPFRDAKMGMLPPKLAQIMINLANPNFDEKIIDPFCGSGTINSEAAIMGYKTIGSDLNAHFLNGARKNFEFLSKKFRFSSEVGEFFIADATKFPYEKYKGTIVTEGFLGENFERRPSRATIDKNAKKILLLWESIFEKIKNSKIKKFVFCLPCWNFHDQKISISKKLFAKISKNSYISRALFNKQKTFVYERDGAFVGREICVVEKL